MNNKAHPGKRVLSTWRGKAGLCDGVSWQQQQHWWERPRAPAWPQPCFPLPPLALTSLSPPCSMYLGGQTSISPLLCFIATDAVHSPKQNPWPELSTLNDGLALLSELHNPNPHLQLTLNLTLLLEKLTCSC